LQPEARQLCEELLSMAEKESAALGVGNLDDLEQSLARKVQVLDELTVIGFNGGEASLFVGELSEVFEQVRNAHNKVRDGVRSMLDACENEIVNLRRGQKAHRAYHRGRASGTRREGRKQSNGRGGAGVRRRVL
jgi:hypothetical protein